MRERHWSPWETNIRQGCRREDFRTALPGLLEGTDNRFRAYVLQILEQGTGLKSAERLKR